MKHYQYVTPCTQHRRHSGKQTGMILPFTALNKLKEETDKEASPVQDCVLRLSVRYAAKRQERCLNWIVIK